MLLEFERPDRCVVGTVGQPGNRLFLIQVAQGSRLAAGALEKQQAQLLAGLRHARRSIARGELVVLPTDTVYGVAADAFSPAAVAALLAAKGRGRQSPPPVLVSGASMLAALVSEVPEPIEQPARKRSASVIAVRPASSRACPAASMP